MTSKAPTCDEFYEEENRVNDQQDDDPVCFGESHCCSGAVRSVAPKTATKQKTTDGMERVKGSQKGQVARKHRHGARKR